MGNIWDSKGNALCGSCGKFFGGGDSKQSTLQMLRARGWHYSQGVTFGGQAYEDLLCPVCARNEHTRVRKVLLDQGDDVLPLDWETLRAAQQQSPGYQVL